jgi:predicted nucleic acid-binding protein
MILVDSDILIDYSRHDDTAANWLDEKSAETDLAISVITEMELIYGSRNKFHLSALRKLLLRFEVLHINEEVSLRASALVGKYSLSHRLALPDALIAATALEFQIGLATINRRDFRSIEDLQLINYP